VSRCADQPFHAAMDRRTFLRGSAAVGGALVVGAAPSGIWARPAHAGTGAVRVYLVVVDGLRPDQVGRMPQLAELAEAGTFYTAGRAGMVAETGPNHTAMVTGMRAARNGHAGNSVPGLPENVGEDPRYLKADSLFTLIQRQAPEYRTASVNAKTYVTNTQHHDRTASGDGDADSVYDAPVTEPDDAARDVFTGPEGLRVSQDVDPDFLFWNLGDVDRAGHLDVSGGLFDGVEVDGTEPAFQAVALQQADVMLRGMVEQLKQDGRWEETVFIVTADHSMDWSMADRFIDLAGDFEADDLLADEVVTAVNGGACLYALRSPDDPDADERLKRMRAIALATEGVRDALYLRPNPADGGEEHFVGRVHPQWGLLGDYTGELIVTVEQGWRIGHGGMDSNPIPGNHGHPETLPIPVIVSGGWEGIRSQRIEPDGDVALTDEPDGQARNIDLAPTAAWLLGLNPPPGGFDGRVLAEAFDRRPTPRVDVQNVQSMPVIDRIGGADPYLTAVALSQEALPDGYDDSRPPGAQPVTTGNETLDDEILGQLPLPDERILVVASGEAPTSALTAGPLAARFVAPLLLARPDGLPSEVAAEVERLQPDRALVIGGTDVLGDAVVDALQDAGVGEVERLEGDDAALAAEVARRMGVSDDNRQIILTGGDPASLALAAPSAAFLRRRPVLLTGPDALPAATQEVLEDLDIDRVLIAGDTSVVSASLESQLRDAGRVVERLDGATEETGRLLAERAVREGAPTDDLYVATTADPGAALALGPALALLRGSMVLVHGERLGDGAARRFVTERADELVRIRFVGDVAAAAADDVEEAVRDRRTREFEVDDPDLSPPADGTGPPSDDDRPGRPDDPGRPEDGPGRRPQEPSTRAAGDRPLPATGGSGLLAGLAALGLAGALRLRGRTPPMDADGV
jgi:ectonucleotide pyrophosphatase/phosphodiesterase family member 5